MKKFWFDLVDTPNHTIHRFQRREDAIFVASDHPDPWSLTMVRVTCDSLNPTLVTFEELDLEAQFVEMEAALHKEQRKRQKARQLTA